MTNIGDKVNQEIIIKEYLSAEERSERLGEERSYGGYEPTGETITTCTLVHSVTVGNLAHLLDGYLNLGGKGYREGVEFGRYFQSTHRTLQQCFVGFLMGALMGLAEMDEKFTDARNEDSIAMIQKLKKLIDDGELAGHFRHI